MRSSRARAPLALLLCLLSAASAPRPQPCLWWTAVEVRPPADAALAYVGGLQLRGRPGRLNSFSALEISDDGARVALLTDRAEWLEAGLLRGPDGALKGLDAPSTRPILDRGARMPFERRDSEGLAIAGPDLGGDRFAAFERVHRLARLARGGASEQILLTPPSGGRSPPDNRGWEALALAPDGALLAFEERGARRGDPIPGLRLSPSGEVRRFQLPRLGPGAVTGADIDARGRLWVVVRRLRWFDGFGFSIWRYALRDGVPVDGEALLALPRLRGGDNGEGIAVWTGVDGRVRAIVVTDDNRSSWQRGLLLEFVERQAPADDPP